MYEDEIEQEKKSISSLDSHALDKFKIIQQVLESRRS
jgi:hypothetical protein